MFYGYTFLSLSKTLEYRTGRKPLFWSICMPELAWKKCKQTAAFYHSLYSNFLVLISICNSVFSEVTVAQMAMCYSTGQRVSGSIPIGGLELRLGAGS